VRQVLQKAVMVEVMRRSWIFLVLFEIVHIEKRWASSEHAPRGPVVVGTAQQ